MKALSYIHYSINAKSGRELADIYGNLLFLSLTEANEYGKDICLDSTESGNEVEDYFMFINSSDRTITKKERKSAEHEFRQSSYNNANYWN